MGYFKEKFRYVFFLKNSDSDEPQTQNSDKKKVRKSPMKNEKKIRFRFTSKKNSDSMSFKKKILPPILKNKKILIFLYINLYFLKQKIIL